MDKVSKADIQPYQDAVNNASLINEELTGSKVVKTKRLPEFNAVEWTLGNGAKVVFRKADYDKDAVSLLPIVKEVLPFTISICCLLLQMPHHLPGISESENLMPLP